MYDETLYINVLTKVKSIKKGYESQYKLCVNKILYVRGNIFQITKILLSGYFYNIHTFSLAYFTYLDRFSNGSYYLIAHNHQLYIRIEVLYLLLYSLYRNNNRNDTFIR